MKKEITDVRSRVAAAILTNAGVGQAMIEVEEKEGCIVLKGSASTEKDKQLAEYIASCQDGVIKVINEIICE